MAADAENVHDHPAAEPLPEPAAAAEEPPRENPPFSRSDCEARSPCRVAEGPLNAPCAGLLVLALGVAYEC